MTLAHRLFPFASTSTVGRLGVGVCVCLTGSRCPSLGAAQTSHRVRASSHTKEHVVTFKSICTSTHTYTHTQQQQPYAHSPAQSRAGFIGNLHLDSRAMVQKSLRAHASTTTTTMNLMWTICVHVSVIRGGLESGGDMYVLLYWLLRSPGIRGGGQSPAPLHSVDG